MIEYKYVLIAYPTLTSCIPPIPIIRGVIYGVNVFGSNYQENKDFTHILSSIIMELIRKFRLCQNPDNCSTVRNSTVSETYYYRRKHTMTSQITREEALKLLKKYNQEPFHILHALTVEGTDRKSVV